MASLAPAPSAGPPASPAPFRRKLRVGVVADVPYQPRWLVEALGKVAASDFAEIAFVRAGSPRRRREASPVWKAYSRLEQRLFGSGQWSRPADVTSLVAKPGADEGVDIVVALGDVTDDEIGAQPACGVWRYCFGHDAMTRESHAGVREVLEGEEVTGSGIRVHVPGRADRIVYQSWSRTLAFSASRNRDNVFAKASEFLLRGLRDLHREGPAYLDRAQEMVSGTTSREIVPDTISAFRMATRVAQRAVEKLATVEQWSLAFRFAPEEPWTGSLAGFHRLTPPGDGFWADPFPIQRGGKSYIVFEELPPSSRRAHISVMEVDRYGRASKPVRVIERDYHLSYPFLVEDEGQLYMVPESAENRTIELYRCIDFPGKWRRERVLVDHVFAADATLHRHGGRWWMFANVAANGAEIHDELHVFTSDRLTGDWQPLDINPVKSDVRGARPAGRLFEQDGQLYRPAQICAPLYGSGISLQRVTRLDAQGFEEHEERRIVPAAGEGVLGLHTMNRAGDLSVTDAFVRRARFH